jgi:hypothetical protein
MTISLNHLLDYEYKTLSEDFDPHLNDFEAAELGRCKEIIGDEAYMPCHKSREWVRCFIAICPQPYSYR